MDGSAARTQFSPSSIRSKIEKAIATPPPEEAAAVPDAALPDSDKVDPLPRPGDAYKVAGRHGNKPDLTIHFVMKDYSYEGFSYADLERVRLVPSEKPGSGPVLVLRFNGSVITEVQIEGRHLHGMYHWISLHRLPWLWEHPSPAAFADEKASLISRITPRVIDR